VERNRQAANEIGAKSDVDEHTNAVEHHHNDDEHEVPAEQKLHSGTGSNNSDGTRDHHDSFFERQERMYIMGGTRCGLFMDWLFVAVAIVCSGLEIHYEDGLLNIVMTSVELFIVLLFLYVFKSSRLIPIPPDPKCVGELNLYSAYQLITVFLLFFISVFIIIYITDDPNAKIRAGLSIANIFVCAIRFLFTWLTSAAEMRKKLNFLLYVLTFTIIFFLSMWIAWIRWKDPIDKGFSTTEMVLLLMSVFAAVYYELDDPDGTHCKLITLTVCVVTFFVVFIFDIGFAWTMSGDPEHDNDWVTLFALLFEAFPLYRLLTRCAQYAHEPASVLVTKPGTAPTVVVDSA